LNQTVILGEVMHTCIYIG